MIWKRIKMVYEKCSGYRFYVKYNMNQRFSYELRNTKKSLKITEIEVIIRKQRLGWS